MDSLLSTALEAAEAAAAVHRHYFGSVSLEGAEDKSHSDFVTRVDLEAQEAALTVIQGRFPDHAILAEEETQAGTAGPRTDARTWPDDGGFLWIVDPLDGTTNYLHRHPYFAASVGVGRRLPETERETPGGTGAGQGGTGSGRAGTGAGQGGTGSGRAGAGAGQAGSGATGMDTGVVSDAGVALEASVVLEAGAVVASRTGERWWARRGRGAFKNGVPITVSPQAVLRKALIGTGFPFKKPELVSGYLEEFRRVLPASSGIRRTGSASMDLCYLAEGILDGFWEDFLSPWDIAAGLVILAEAGGVASRVDGGPIDLSNGPVLAANSTETVEALRDLVLDR
jgi:fructose-1,6-bisphosphatase/inositol monophosphatase family enzyme